MEIGEKLSKLQQDMKVPKDQYNKFGKFYYRNAETILAEFKKYEKKMAVAAMKKQIPKKVIKKEYEGEEITGYLCPTCQEVLLHQWDDGFIIGNKKSYCDKCGQRLDWSDEQ